ncbi:hypothetical protein Q5O14_15845 [Eubacteriaceae bacterium ES2]|nr:hypothetical protein Q5O14_15845 [Eubacteriaceae bacterium ES2]
MTYTYVGGIAGCLDGSSTINNCSFSGTLTGTSTSINLTFGGIVGYSKGTSNISNCCVSAAVSATVTGTGAGTNHAGGIIGSDSGNTSILTNVYYLESASYQGYSNTADTADIHAVSDFSTGYVAWSLQNPAGTSQATLVWGQTLGASGDLAPVLISDATGEADKQVYQLLFYDTNGTSLLNTCYANNSGTTIDFPDPGTGNNWMNGSTEFTSSSLVTNNLSLVKTAIPYSGGGGGGSSTPTMTGISVKPVIISPGQILTAADFDMTGQPDGATVYYSTDGVTYTTTPPSFEETGTYTVYIKITASGYQDYTTTTTVTVKANDDGRSVTLFPLDDTGTQPTALPGGGYGYAYSYNLGTALSTASTTDATGLDDTLSASSITGYTINSIDDPYGLLADGQDAPTIDEQGLFSCFLNYAAASPTGQTAAKTSADSGTLTETTATASTQSTNNLASVTAADDTIDTNINSSDTVMLTAAVVINVTLNSGDITPITLDIEVPQELYNVTYRTHIQNLGWEESFAENGNLSGTQGQSLRLEAIEIQMDTDYDLGVSYRTHVQNLGWEENYVSDGQESGTDGQGLRLEAIELSLTGADTDYFDIYYQVHVQNLGWLDWASNGDPAGSAGFGYRLEGIRIVVVPKGSDAPGVTENCFVEQ